MLIGAAIALAMIAAATVRSPRAREPAPAVAPPTSAPAASPAPPPAAATPEPRPIPILSSATVLQALQALTPAAPAVVQAAPPPAAPTATPPAAPLPPPPVPPLLPEPVADALEAALQADPRPFQEGHWNGLEVIPATAQLRAVLELPPDVPGVVVDDVTLPADLEGFEAGDLITAINDRRTGDIRAFMAAADIVRDRRRANVELIRRNGPRTLVLTAADGRLGTANGETAPMIRAGARPPHDYLGPCTQCHRIGTNGQLARDPGDAFVSTAPTIHAGQTPPHRDRGACASCHTVIP